ncbi:hypothetical protein HNR40_008855 [Nonomuraea endophytica]|uniref:Uncharacterized protein n=1 Tax=Nonomuraea endophytica TaxID=714136 RepID=A0A7W8ELX1_9ACTN|nr:hypothetical protein [Nonomuraea endophytica]
MSLVGEMSRPERRTSVGGDAHQLLVVDVLQAMAIPRRRHQRPVCGAGV